MDRLTYILIFECLYLSLGLKIILKIALIRAVLAERLTEWFFLIRTLNKFRRNSLHTCLIISSVWGSLFSLFGARFFWNNHSIIPVRPGHTYLSTMTAKNIDTKREEFRKYLEKEGVLESLTKALVIITLFFKT